MNSGKSQVHVQMRMGHRLSCQRKTLTLQSIGTGDILITCLLSLRALVDTLVDPDRHNSAAI